MRPHSPNMPSSDKHIHVFFTKLSSVSENGTGVLWQLLRQQGKKSGDVELDRVCTGTRADGWVKRSQDVLLGDRLRHIRN